MECHVGVKLSRDGAYYGEFSPSLVYTSQCDSARSAHMPFIYCSHMSKYGSRDIAAKLAGLGSVAGGQESL